jgi:glycine dehydrogenase subunit 1
MRYLPHTEAEIRAMLEVAGKANLDELFESIPAEARFSETLAVPAALAEPALMRHLSDLSARNTASEMLSFLGAGAYDHHIPPAVDQLLLRGELYTAYTPYQPEVAQGTLQAIFEFQTMVSELYGLPLANASVYDGASAAAEGAQMARRLTKRDRVLLCGSLHPQYREVVKTYLAASGHCIDLPVSDAGVTDLQRLEQQLDEDTAAVLVGYPSFYGPLPDLGALGCDIAVGEGQPLACSPNFGGPGVGLFACRNDRAYLQQLPGRLCGETVDSRGKRGYVLTLSTREQHIRRERATSNICTNQGLLALSFAIRVSLLGKRGFVEVAEACHAKASYLRSRILELNGFSAAFAGQPWFNEFTVRVRGGDAAVVCRKLEQQGIIAGLDLGRFYPELRDCLLLAVTEKHEKAMLDHMVQALDSV